VRYRRSPCPGDFPYTTLFRSIALGGYGGHDVDGRSGVLVDDAAVDVGRRHGFGRDVEHDVDGGGVADVAVAIGGCIGEAVGVGGDRLILEAGDAAPVVA